MKFDVARERKEQDMESNRKRLKDISETGMGKRANTIERGKE